MIFNAASSCWSGLPIEESVQKIAEGKTFEPLLGIVASEHIQICPQHSGYISEAIVEELVTNYPKTQFRLHSDIRLKNKRGITIDLSDYSKDTAWYFQELAKLSKQMNANTYSLHAGRRAGTLQSLKEKYLKVQEIFGDITVAVEGLYPAGQNKWFISNWKEYSWLAENSIPYALDLSHLEIVKKRFGKNESLVKELVHNNLCKEIHISFNDGNLDSHDIAQENFRPTFNQHLEFLQHKDKDTVIFTEGNQVLFGIRQKRLLEAQQSK